MLRHLQGLDKIRSNPTICVLLSISYLSAFMKNFTCEISTVDYGPCTFRFSRLYTAGAIVYYVTTGSATGSHTFTMVANDREGWRIIDAPKVPDWILALEKELSDRIVAASSPGGE